MPTQSEIEATLGQVSRQDDGSFDAALAALLVSALDHRGAELDRYRRHLDDLATATAERANMEPAAALADVIARLYGYQGDRHTYDDMKNADLLTVIDRRRGLPVALGILYLAAARSLSVPLVGLAFPGHFLMRVENGNERVVIDPFGDGRPTSPGMLRRLIKRIQGPDAELEPAFFTAVTPRAIVIRLLMNGRIRAAKSGNLERTIELVRRMTLIAPNDARLWADLAELHAARGNLSAAASAFERSIARAPDDNFRAAAELALERVRHTLN
jgi:regulator of sirC expression with transglutaminase-like and TPR domain